MTDTFPTHPARNFCRSADEVLRNGARALLAQAVDAEVAALLSLHVDKLTDAAFTRGGGLLSHGIDRDEQFRQAVDYVARILVGEKTSQLPVQTPTKFRLALNLKTAKELDLAVPPTVLAVADEVIE